MSLQDPARKMSKSDPEETYIAILDDPDVIRRKLKRAVTDSLGQIHYDPENQPGVANLMSIYGALKGVDMTQVERDFEGMGYGELKNGVADVIIAELSPLQAEYRRIMADKAYLQQVLSNSAERAAHIAQRTLDKVYRKVGLAPRKL